MKTERSANPRAVAARIIAAVVDDGHDLDSALEQQLAALSDPRDRALAQRLSYTTLRWLPALRWLLDQLLNKPLRGKKRPLERLLWVGLAQLWREQMPGHAVVHSTVAAADELGQSWAKGLVNACLRRFQREQQSLLQGLDASDAHHALPDDWLAQLRQDWPEQWQSIVAASHQQAPMWLRVNRRQCSRADFLAALKEANIDASTGPGEDAVRLHQALAVDRIPGFADGWFAVQDAAAQGCVELLDLQPGQRVLDACAAPGGKTCHILERQPQVSLLALDRDPQRLARIEDNLRRLRLDDLDCEVRCADAAAEATWPAGQAGFDRILLDAPCSASGVVRRHPDIPWRRPITDLQILTGLQQQLLQRLWPQLKPGGMLVYATCSIFRCENQQQIQQFLDQEPTAEAVPPPPWGLAAGAGCQVLPGMEERDGFYYAVLRRTAERL
ncbi:MAG: 16S rRNA (cytosine(967)-C(5))-methyltransferase RsmB [Wenzhouxiangellaceae bacterium]